MAKYPAHSASREPSETPWAGTRRSFGRVLKEVGRFFHREDPRRISLFDRSTLFFAVVVSGWFAVAYLLSGSTPGLSWDERPGWLGWYDQGQYMKSTTDLANGLFKPEVYWIGYPILAVPFYHLMPRHPYFIPDLVLVLFMVGSFYACCRHEMSRAEAWILIGVFIFFEPILRDQSLIIPWNTLPTYAAIYLSTYLLVFARAGWTGFAVSALAIGGALMARPNEIVSMGPLFLGAVLAWRDARKWWAIAFLGVVLASVGIFMVAVNFHFYGKISSPYMRGESTKFSHTNLGWKLYQLLCDGAFLTGDSPLPQGTRATQILERFPFFLLLVPGIVYLLRARGMRAWGLLLAMACSVGFYLTYNLVDNPAYFWSYGSYHYFWWIIPWLAFLSYISLRRAPFVLPRAVYFTALLAPVLIYAFIGFKAVEVAATDTPAATLAIATAYRDQAFTVKLTSMADAGTIEDVRMKFLKPPGYFGSTIDSAFKMSVAFNGRPQRYPRDYIASQEGFGAFDFSFLAHGLRVKKGDMLTLTFDQTPEPVVQRASLLDIRFAPGRALARYFTP
jgi:hypothetical protein